MQRERTVSRQIPNNEKNTSKSWCVTNSKEPRRCCKRAFCDKFPTRGKPLKWNGKMFKQKPETFLGDRRVIDNNLAAFCASFRIIKGTEMWQIPNTLLSRSFHRKGDNGARMSWAAHGKREKGVNLLKNNQQERSGVGRFDTDLSHKIKCFQYVSVTLFQPEFVTFIMLVFKESDTIRWKQNR